MVERGMYFATEELKQLIRSVGGEWNDTKARPIVCLVKSTECEGLYWAIPVGNLAHRNPAQRERLERYLAYPERDIRSCYYHIARTTTMSIFFISDAIPISEKYIERAYTYGGAQYVIKNPQTISELERKLFRLLAVENASPNKYRQRITDVKKKIIAELKAEGHAQR